MYSQSLVAIFLGFITSLLLSKLFIVLSLKTGLALDDPNADARRIHCRPIPRIGGLAILCSFALTVFGVLPTSLWNNSQVKGFVVGTILITLLGFLDDLQSFDGRYKLLGQVLIIFLIVFGFDLRIPWINNPLRFVPFFSETGNLIYFPDWVSVIISGFWILVMTNTMNFVDGIDGFATSMTIVFSIVIGAVAILFNQSVLLVIIAALLGGCLGFLPVNWYRAKAFLGDGGSMLLGFCIGTLSILSGAKLATTMLILGLLSLDVFNTFLIRFRRGQSLFMADNEHIHYRLLKKGLSTTQAVFLISVISLLFGLLSLSNDTTTKVISLVMLGVVAEALIFWSMKP